MRLHMSARIHLDCSTVFVDLQNLLLRTLLYEPIFAIVALFAPLGLAYMPNLHTRVLGPGGDCYSYRLSF